MLITLIASLSIFGIGSGLFSIEISKISYINSISPKFKTTKSEFNVKMQDNLLIDTNTHYEYVIDKATGHKCKIENNLIKDVKVVKGNVQIELKLKENYNKALKFMYYVEV